MSEMLTPRQVAEMMGLTVKTVYQYLNTGQIPGALKDERGHWQIPSSAVPPDGAFEQPVSEEASQEGPATSHQEPAESQPPHEELTMEERAARRERERAAALAAMYAQVEPLEETSLDDRLADGQNDVSAIDDLVAQEALEREAEPEKVYAQEEGYAVENLDAMDDEEDPDAQDDLDEEAALEEYYAQRELEREESLAALYAEEALVDDVPDVTQDDAPEGGPEASAGDYYGLPVAHDTVEPDDYVMDVAPAASGPVAARAVQVDPGSLEFDVVDLAAIDLAQIASAQQKAPVEAGDAPGGPPNTSGGSNIAVWLAIAGVVLVILTAIGFIVNLSMGLFDETADAVPAADAVPVAVAPASDDTRAVAEPVAAADVDASDAGSILPKVEGETLFILPAFAGADPALNARLRDAIDTQAQALGLTNVRAEVEPMILAADQSGQAAELGAQYQADVMMWGEDRGEELIVNLMSMPTAGVPAWEAIAPAENMRPLSPGAYASYVTTDNPSQLAFLAGLALGQSSILQGDYATAVTAYEQAVASLDSQAAPTAGLDEAFYRLGWLYQTQQADAQQALDAYTLAMQINPDHMGALNNTGMVHDALGDKQQALFFYSQALPLLREAENWAGELQVLNRIGALYNEVGDAQEALSFYGRALPLAMEAGDPATEALSRRRIAMIHKDLGELSEAEEQMAEVIALAEANSLSTLDQDRLALEEIQTLRAQQESQTPVFRRRD